MPTAEGLVSVVVPSFEGERFIADALTSIVGQTHEELEVVVCDDGSTDGTLDIVEDFARDDHRVRVERGDRRLGPVGNFERSLRIAAGPYVKFLMQDDVLAPHAIERLLGALTEAEDIVLATSRRRRIDAAGHPLPDRAEMQPPVTEDTVLSGTELGNRVLVDNLNLIGEPSTVLFRRAALGEVAPFTLGGPPYRYLADLALWLTLLQRGRAAYLVEPLSSSRAHAGQDSAVRANMVVSILEWERVHREAAACGFLADPGDRAAARDRWLANAPFFFRFCTGPAQASQLARRIVALDREAVRAGERSRAAATASTLRAIGTAPVAGLFATPVHRARARRRRRR
jgi:glycosyltransferase involved in cell wall biosynthesis